MKQVVFLMILLVNQLVLAQRISLGIEGTALVSSANSFLGIQQNKVFTNDLSISNIRGSVGAGFSIGMDVGFKLNEYASLHLAYSDFFGSKTVFFHNELNGVYQHIEGNTTQYRLLPGIKFQIPGKKIDFFMQSSLLFPFASESTLQREETGVDGSASQYLMEYNVQYNWSVGYQNTLGFSCKIAKQFQFQLAIQSYLMNLTSKTKKITSYQIDETDQLSTLTEYEKVILYRDDLNNFNNNETYNSLYNTNKPKEELKYTQSFNALALQLKIVYRFKSKSERQ